MRIKIEVFGCESASQCQIMIIISCKSFIIKFLHLLFDDRAMTTMIFWIKKWTIYLITPKILHILIFCKFAFIYLHCIVMTKIWHELHFLHFYLRTYIRCFISMESANIFNAIKLLIQLTRSFHLFSIDIVYFDTILKY